ncbi:MAG: GH3 auxin-responsive promoter family protein [Bacteroidia bacterium]|nr:GH3 auxin-responsive promoter family protein [Bacteroidia bacterium]
MPIHIINSLATWYIKKRLHEIDLFIKYPIEVQNEWLLELVHIAKDTEFGIKHKFTSITDYNSFSNQIPLQDYESLKNYIERNRKGEQNLLWPTDIFWFAKSSGTTNKSKFIPVSEQTLHECHYNGGKDMIALYVNNYENSKLFTGKNLALGGTWKIFENQNHTSYYGDVSAIIIQNLPILAELFRAPDIKIALMDEWEKKLELLSETMKDENVVSMAGVPSWMLVLLKKILHKKNAQDISEVWPNLEVYFHGGINYEPYRKNFQQIFGKQQVNLVQLYNASEGFFAIQDRPNADDMLLMLDYGIYYEFIPEEYFDAKEKKTVNLENVELHKTYSMVISTTSGLWRYQIGDTIQFTSLNPFRIKIVGRTKQFINAFGEELMVHNADEAISEACKITNAIITDYTVSPVYMNESSGTHQWIIEFEKLPNDLNYFAYILDNTLKEKNSDYEAKRYNDYVIAAPQIIIAPPNTFYLWLKKHNKLGGQHKVPRLSNDRKIAEEILQIIHDNK